MAEIVGSLFGVTADDYERRLVAQDEARAIQMANLAPGARGAAMIQAGAAGLGRSIGSMLGAQDPQLQIISARQKILGTLDPNRPETFDQGVQMALQSGDQQLAYGLRLEADKFKQQALVRQDAEQKRRIAMESQARAQQAQSLLQGAYQPATPEQQQFVEVDDQGQPVTIPGRQASFDINPVLPQLMRLGPEGQAAISQQAKLLPDLRRLGAASMREENPFAMFTTDATIPKNVQTLAQQYAKSFASGVLDPEKADARVKELTEMTQRVQQFEQNQQQIKDNQAIMQSLRQQGLENSEQALLIQRGNQALQAQNIQFQQDMKKAESDRKEEERKNKPLPSFLAKEEETDYTTAKASTDLASDAFSFINRIKQGEIKFGLKDKASIRARQLVGSKDPDVIAREDYDKFLTVLVNESLRLNKGTQTEGDAVRAAKELQSSESPEAAASAMNRLLNINVRRAQNSADDVLRRRKNAGFPDPVRPVEVPKFDVQIINNNDYNSFLKNPKFPSGTVFIDPKGVRRVKP
jgi:hypothetical protein